MSRLCTHGSSRQEEAEHSYESQQKKFSTFDFRLLHDYNTSDPLKILTFVPFPSLNPTRHQHSSRSTTGTNLPARVIRHVLLSIRTSTVMNGVVGKGPFCDKDVVDGELIFAIKQPLLTVVSFVPVPSFQMDED
jgi:hypothetical protein